MCLMISAVLLSACDSAEERAEKHFQSAIALIAQGDTDRAMVELRNAFNLDGRHMDARRTMAELQLDRGNRTGAYRQYLRLAEAYPEDLDSRIMLSELAFSAGNWEEFDRHATQAEELAPEHPRVEVISLIRAYRSAIDENDAPTRRRLASRAAELLVDLPENILLRNTLIDDALREQELTRALTHIDWLIGFEPMNSRHYQERLRVLAMSGDMAAVEQQLIDLMEIFPEDLVHGATLVRFYLSRDNLDAAEAVLRDLSAASDEPGLTIDLIRFLATFRGPEAVRAEIERAAAEHADPVPFRIIEASYEFSLGNRDEAIATLQDVTASSEPSEEVRDAKVTLAQMLLTTGNEVGARAHIEEILTEEGTHPEALKMQAAWQIEADDTDAAIGGLRTALDQNPQDAETMTLIATAYGRAGQPELAKDFLAQAVEASGNAPAETLRYARVLIEEERYLPAEDILLTALRLTPDHADILITLGQLYLRMEDFGRVQSVVGTLRRIGGEAAVQAANGIEAERLSRQQGLDKAMAFLEELANDADATLATKITLVNTRLGIDDRAGALLLAQELKQENPDSEALDVVLAVAEIANGNLEAGTEIYRDLLAVNPVRPRIWLELSTLQLRQGDLDAAETIVDEGLEHSPEDAGLLWAKASYRQMDDDIEGALAIYETLYAKNSNSIILANNIASLLSTYRDDAASLERAWIIARRLRDATLPPFKDTFGWILHRRGESDEALPYLEEAAQGMPDDALVQYHLGQVYIALERPQDALEQMRKAVTVAGPTDTRPQIEEARALVQSLQNVGTAEN
ncbi:tetratricopeptide repeat protein [Marinovum sp.]|uniref:tetratricopeptide repeat protein n=1 Tax=Marinovum sp. TaxID=2024839 RepID=UPI003A8CD33B